MTTHEKAIEPCPVCKSEIDLDPHEVLHVYDGDGGVIIRENGNVSTFGVQSREVMAAFNAATALLPEDAADIVAEMTSEDFRHEMQHLRSSSEIDRLFQRAASLIQSQAARIAELEAGLLVARKWMPVGHRNGLTATENMERDAVDALLNGERKG